MAEVSRRLEEQLGPDEEVGVAAITASELLHGVHRVTPERRARREAFVEAVLAAFPPLPFELLAARARPHLWSAGRLPNPLSDWIQNGHYLAPRGAVITPC